MDVTSLRKGSSGTGAKVVVNPTSGSPSLIDAKKIWPGGLDEAAITSSFNSKAHPVGSYLELDSETDPKTLYGGTWEKISGYFVGNDGSSSNGAKVGSKTVTLTIANLPSHVHPWYMRHSHAIGTDSDGKNGNKTYSHNHGNTSHYHSLSYTSDSHRHTFTHSHTVTHSHATGGGINNWTGAAYLINAPGFGDRALIWQSGGKANSMFSVDTISLSTNAQSGRGSSESNSSTSTGTCSDTAKSDSPSLSTRTKTYPTKTTAWCTLNEYNGPVSIGGGQAHDNMPPYRATNIWKRTA